MGVAAAVVTTAQQVGASIGVAMLNTIAAGISDPVAGYATAAGWAAGILAVAAAGTAVLIKEGRK